MRKIASCLIMLGGLCLFGLTDAEAAVSCTTKEEKDRASLICTENKEATYKCTFTMLLELVGGDTSSHEGNFTILKGEKDKMVYSQDKVEGKKIKAIKAHKHSCNRQQ